jgi:Cu2+-containing amine oxidase
MSKGKQSAKAPWALLVSGIILLGAFALVGASGSELGPLPFDPLSEAEQQKAVELTLADPEVQRVLSEDHEIIGAALNTDKHRLRADPQARQADVWIYDYETDHTLWSQVDLRGVEVVSFLLTDEFQPPMTVAERDRAARLALEDPAVQQVLEEHEYQQISWIGRLWTGEGETACPEHRCILVAFILDGDYLPDPMVRVNLSLRIVEGILDGIGQEETPRLGGVL